MLDLLKKVLGLWGCLDIEILERLGNDSARLKYKVKADGKKKLHLASLQQQMEDCIKNPVDIGFI